MRGGPYEQDTRDMDGKMTAMVARQFRNNIVGIKVAHYNGSEWTPVDEAVKAGTAANIPVMVDFGGNTPPLPIEELFMNRLRKGDIFTHCFGQLTSRIYRRYRLRSYALPCQCCLLPLQLQNCQVKKGRRYLYLPVEAPLCDDKPVSMSSTQ